MLTRLRLENFKSWRNTGEIPLKPITGLFGTNSSGKSSLFQPLLVMKQTDELPGRGTPLHFGDERTLVDLGDFESVIHKNDTEQTLRFSFGWNSKNKFEIPMEYGDGIVAPGDDIGFDVQIREERNASGRFPIVKEMSYRIPGRRRLGMRRLPLGTAYKLFASGFQAALPDYFGAIFHPRPSKAHEFPYMLQTQLEHNNFVSSLQYGLELFLRDLHYLGPLRTYPRRIYRGSGAQPSDMGSAGEFTVDALLSSGQQGVGVWDGSGSHVPTDEYVARWLKRLGLVHDFRVVRVVEGRRLVEVKVRKAPGMPEVLLTDVGFGVSQLLPELVLCFYVPRSSTVILEQPDIHLHPSAQAGLADVFIDAWKKHDVQILFESHSEHLLRRLQRRIAEGEINQDDVGLYFCSLEDSGESTLSHLELDAYGNISNWPKDFFGDQFGEIAGMSEAALRRQVKSD